MTFSYIPFSNNMAASASSRLPNAVTTTLGKKADKLIGLVKDFNEKENIGMLVGMHSGPSAETATGETGGQPQQPQRTACQPIFEHPNMPLKCTDLAVPHQVLEMAQFEKVPRPGCSFWHTDFKFDLRLKAQTTPPVSKEIQVCIEAENNNIWLVNIAETGDVELTGGELFGYNVGSFTEKSIGRLLKRK